MSTDDDPAVSVCFTVVVDGQNLGAFNSCEGLGLEIVLEQREEGGNNGMVWQLPSRIKFTNIKLSRPIGADSAKLMEWIVNAINKPKPTNAEINAMTAEGKPVAGWTLEGVIPVRWTGPSLNVDTAKVATETFEIAHHGISAKKK